MEPRHKKIIILGSGPAGATAAIYASRAMHEVLLLTGSQYGGQLTLTTDIENYPGFCDNINGTTLVEQMLQQAKKYNAKICMETAIEVNLKTYPFSVLTENNKLYSCDALIIATGSKAKWLGLDSETKYRAGGVSTCAVCDGFLYKNKNVIVVGGGNSATEEALYLSKLANQVAIIHRRDKFTAEKISQERIFKTQNISIMWSTVIEEITGSKNQFQQDIVNGVKVRDLKTNKIKHIPTDGVFIAIGHTPQSELFKGQLDLYDNGYIKTAPDSTCTNIEGIFVAGDVGDYKYRQAITAAGRGCMAAMEADNFLKMREK